MRSLKRLKTLPTKGWLESIGYALLFGEIAFLVDPTLFNLSNAPPLAELIEAGIIAFIIPALSEEIIFRGLLLPKRSPGWVALSLSSYVLWHPLEALTFLPESATYFLSIKFLCLVALLGIFCTFAYFRTGSLWTSILIHWLVVVAWKASGGAGFAF